MSGSERDRIDNDRVGCPRTNDRRAGPGLLSPDFASGAADAESTGEPNAAVEMSVLWKSQNDFHRTLEISHSTRDSHIPTSHIPLGVR